MHPMSQLFKEVLSSAQQQSGDANKKSKNRLFHKQAKIRLFFYAKRKKNKNVLKNPKMTATRK